MSNVDLAGTNFILPNLHGQFSDLFFLEIGSSTLVGRQLVFKRLRLLEQHNFEKEKLKEQLRLLHQDWSTFNHPNIGGIFETTILVPGSANLPSIVAPFYLNGNIRAYAENICAADRLRLMKEVLHGLEYLHNIPVTHGNIYPGNILIDTEGHAIITDIGLNSLIRRHATYLPSPECYHYMSPELLIKNEPPTPASDMYSFAWTVEELLTLSTPFSNVPYGIFLRQLGRGKLKGIAEHPNIPPPLGDILQDCVTDSIHNRPSAQIVLHRLQLIQI